MVRRDIMFDTVSREVRPRPERYDSGFGIRDSGENPQIKAQSEQCFWHCASQDGIAFECMILIFQTLSCFALRAMTGFKFVAAYNFDRNHHATLKLCGAIQKMNLSVILFYCAKDCLLLKNKKYT